MIFQSEDKGGGQNYMKNIGARHYHYFAPSPNIFLTFKHFRRASHLYFSYYFAPSLLKFEIPFTRASLEELIFQ